MVPTAWSPLHSPYCVHGPHCMVLTVCMVPTVCMIPSAWSPLHGPHRMVPTAWSPLHGPHCVHGPHCMVPIAWFPLHGHCAPPVRVNFCGPKEGRASPLVYMPPGKPWGALFLSWPCRSPWTPHLTPPQRPSCPVAPCSSSSPLCLRATAARLSLEGHRAPFPANAWRLCCTTSGTACLARPMARQRCWWT